MVSMLTTLDALKGELGITGTAEDARLAALIQRQSASIETFCNRVFARRTVTERHRLRNWWNAVPSLYAGPWRDPKPIRLRVGPVVSITEILEDGATLDPALYEIDPEDSQAINRLVEGVPAVPVTWWARDVTITYVAGYVLPGDEDADLPGDIEQCCLDLCVRAYTNAGRDPTLRSETIPGILEQSWTAADGVTTADGLPVDVADRLRFHREIST